MNKVLRGFALFLLVFFSFTGSIWSASPSKVLILQPVLHGPSDMAFLQQGVVDMLATRLAKPGRVVVLTSAEGAPTIAQSQADALAKGRQQGADYVVFGSLTLLGGGVSTDLRVAKTADQSLALSFSRSGKDQGALIVHMDQFAARANQKVFGLSPAPVPAAAPVQPKAKAPDLDSIYQHPEKLLGKPLADESGIANDRRPAGSGFVVTGKQSGMRGPRIKDQVQGVALGDLTGDGRLESVYIGRHSVWVYRYVNGRFAKMAHLKGSGNYVGVDTADLDGDGRAEIFVTNVDDNDGQVISFVLDYDGRKFKSRAENLDYYFRAVNLPGRGRILLGQRSGIDAFFEPGIFEMGFKDGKYRSMVRWKAPRELTIFGVGRGTFSPEDTDQLIAFSNSRYLQLLRPSGKATWKSDDHFGGIAAYVQKKLEDEDMDKESFRYLPARIEVLDLDKDGVDEVVVMRNQESTGTVLKQTRIFKNGRMEVLKADEFGLVTYWQTRNIAKFISDFAIADLDGDGRAEIVAAVVLKTGSSLSNGQSQIYIFNLWKLGKGVRQQ